ncbi:nucleotidyl transferase AbiEii/AbiGii toxin family protein [Flavobacterium sp. DG1-102-2]|uniref:nucleotidyl transferase AbiEii/AbiGii toxin family protein n=1 Tax=Flavobacterium sp. DG1-102-2 TaxID=3081663 RepID=UPI002949280E|nr:nucleotidyl transferase AbiEii/AbiGii toxin family protein [Flavobacterium sp. DG1-102-2]MDV6167125.1 nucleotidyl transferase AbiEii/AbiGii toxin family protein [Flavobacterium sp. DG1-102-2]
MYWNTVNELLRESLSILMQAKEFEPFRLVGGTSLSLQIGHRISVDIDLFTDEDYGSVDFDSIDAFLTANFNYVDADFGSPVGMGRSYLIGRDRENNVKLDLFYTTDKFIQPPLEDQGVRMATIEEIIAMKVDVVSRGGRKKDFWDLHELLPKYTINRMLELHLQRSEHTHDRLQILKNFRDFTMADDDFDPECLRGKYWEFIKEDIEIGLAKII